MSDAKYYKSIEHGLDSWIITFNFKGIKNIFPLVVYLRVGVYISWVPRYQVVDPSKYSSCFLFAVMTTLFKLGFILYCCSSFLLECYQLNQKL